MADSFFGFDSSIPNDDDGGGGIEDTEESYDALNSQTFGNAINGDWEHIHEDLVKRDRRASDIKDDHGESDLVLNLSKVGMNDIDVAKEDGEGRIQLDPSVWASPFKPPEVQPKLVNNARPSSDASFYPDPDAFLRHYFSNPFAASNGPATFSSGSSSAMLQQHQQMLQQQQLQRQQQQLQQQQQQLIQHQQMLLETSMAAKPAAPPASNVKILSVEDIERNIRNQQAPTKADGSSRSQTPLNIHRQPSPIGGQSSKLLPARPMSSLATTNGAAMASPHLNGGVPLKLPARLPPGFAPLPGTGGQPPIGNAPPNMHPTILPPSVQQPQQHRPPMPPPQNMLLPNSNFPVSQMHPNFNGNRPPPTNMPPPNMPPPPLAGNQRLPIHMMHQPPPNHPNHPNFAQNMQFNQRLVQEIQQNHPMLPPFNRLNPNFPMLPPNMHMHPMIQMQLQHQHHLQMMQQHLQQYQQQHQSHQQPGGNNNKGQQPMANPQQFRNNGNLNEDYDEYANLMSNRDKQWLITIQLSQLNTGTPYIDDYYYTVFKERRSRAKGERENQAHKDNQMNHPFSQPTGHAHLVLISLGNKNHNQRNNNHHHNNNNNNNNHHQSNGGHNNNNNNGRERKNSESKDGKEQTPRTYTPLQFENSLGKLQCGSVTAPRKIIDMDVVGAETSSTSGPLATNTEITTQRKSRQLLIHIETLYRVVLKLEDFENPTAIATALVIKERKERERAQALELQLQIQAQLDDNALADEITDKLGKLTPAPEREDEDREQLLAKLLSGLVPEKVSQMMTVRKGKTLLLRAIALIRDVQQRWDIWYGICATLSLLVKKDREDADGKLMALFPAFKEQLTDASIAELLKLGTMLMGSVDVRKVNHMFMNKFAVSCIIVLLLRAEALFTAAPDSISPAAESQWADFLAVMSASAAFNVQANHTLGATLQSDFIKPLVLHFNRFADVKSQPLLTLLTQESA